MELWVRSQDRTTLMKVDRLDIDYSSGLYLIKSDGFGTLLANYKSEERALEVLDEIQKKLNCNKYLLHSTPLIKLKDLEAAKKYYEELNKIDLIADDGRFKIESVGNQILIYEMPKK